MARLTDGYGRVLNYVRVSVTDRCNFRCVYCMPPEGVPMLDHSRVLTYEQIAFLCDVLWELGVGKVRFTGGEPLVRKGLVPFLKKLRADLPDLKIALTTNASLLSRYAPELREVGLHSLNVSLDTLEPEKFKQVTRIGELRDVLEGIEAALRLAIAECVKLNTVLIRGFNDMEIANILRYARERDLLLRLIEFMPLDDTWSEERFIPAREILQVLAQEGNWIPDDRKKSGLDGPARYYRNETTGQEIGIIEAVSNHFCDTCNRLRIGSQGTMRTCLFAGEETDLRPAIESGDRDRLLRCLLEAAAKKPHCWQESRGAVFSRRHMSHIGG